MAKRALLITRNFPPLIGGMERLNHHIYQELKKEFLVAIAGPEGCQEFLAEQATCTTFPSRPVSLFLLKCVLKSCILALKFKPDLIIAGSGVTAPAAWLAAKLSGAKVMVFVHGLDILYPNPIYQFLFLPAIRACDGIWVNSRYTANLAIQKKICEKKITILNPGVLLPKKIIKERIANPFRESVSISENKIILLSAGRLTERKGLPEFISQCLPELVSKFPNLLLLIAGNEATDALNQKTNVTAKISQAIADAKVENHVRLLGKVSDEMLFQAYLASQLFVFPVLNLPGDVEGFGMVAVEAAAHGLPTVAFAVGGITDAIAEGSSGWLVEPGNYAALKTVISEFILGKNKISPESCRQHAEQFSWELFGEKLRSVCLDINN